MKLGHFKKAVSSLEAAFIEFHQHPESTLMRDGIIQRFEYTYEVAWKLIKRYLEEEMGNPLVDAFSKKDLFRTASEAGLIKNPEAWFQYHQARNLTSHTYEEENAVKVFESAVLFLEDVKQLLKEFEKRCVNKHD